MARYEYDDEPIDMRPYVPGKVCVGRGVFAILCLLAALGSFTLLFMVLA